MKTLSFALLVLLLASTASAEILYNVIDLGSLPNSNPSHAYSINNNGQIVGGAFNSSLNFRAILFDPTGGGNNIDLGTLGGGKSTAQSINNNGQIVGLDIDNSQNYRATLFDPTGNGNNIDLGTLGGNFSEAYSINNNGQIAGHAANASSSSFVTLFDSTGFGNNTDLGTLPEHISSFAWSINDNAQVVGYVEYAPNLIDYRITAALFDSTGNGNNLALGTLPGGKTSVAHSINNNEQIVGIAENAADKNRATLFDITGAGNNIDLGTLPGDSDSYARSINNIGQIVGYTINDLEGFRATLFDITGNGNNIDLNTLIDPGLGWKLGIAYCINDNGWIVGSGRNPAGQDRAFLLTPVPEPITLSLLTIGLVIARRKN